MSISGFDTSSFYKFSLVPLKPVPSILVSSGRGRCKLNNGGCWHDTRDGHTYSACVILMNVKKRKHVNALNAAAKIRGAVMSAVAVGTYCTSETMIPA
ncbi:hypothetical protein RND71_000363 [Anisodus tanguticus]|uniref:Uncharacterized protein n=1 Tax=Anisodus tanguticus TaxID=243964 RepID=A0AAE1T149_9SOLA|nr:hypothetical protein RND71_000363 [Anisodus tanguticus]